MRKEGRRGPGSAPRGREQMLTYFVACLQFSNSVSSFSSRERPRAEEPRSAELFGEGSI